MFSDDLGFNPFDKNNNAHAGGNAQNRQRFLSSFNQNHIFCYNGNPRKKISSMSHTDNLLVALNNNVNNNSDVYFYINGGRKMYAINEFTCCFCDMDAGRDNEGKYFKPSIVMKKKKDFLDAINDFPVKPSWVIDTRNGYQCYWIFDDHSRKLVGQNKTYWNGLQKKLVNYFGGDPRAIKANQIYRVPYTWWRKCWEKKAPYFTSILAGSTGQKIQVEQLQSALTGQTTNIVIDPAKCSDQWYKGYAKAYKEADKNGLPVSIDVAQQILRDLTNNNCCQKNTTDSVGIDFSKVSWTTDNNNDIRSTTTKTINSGIVYDEQDSLDDDDDDEYVGQNKVFGEPQPVQPVSGGGDTGCLNLSGQQTKLLKTVVEYLNQASTALYFSNNRFLSSSAKDLAAQLGDQFCVG
jgi:hypothetical protein